MVTSHPAAAAAVAAAAAAAVLVSLLLLPFWTRNLRFLITMYTYIHYVVWWREDRGLDFIKLFCGSAWMSTWCVESGPASTRRMQRNGLSDVT